MGGLGGQSVGLLDGWVGEWVCECAGGWVGGRCRLESFHQSQRSQGISSRLNKRESYVVFSEACLEVGRAQSAAT